VRMRSKGGVTSIVQTFDARSVSQETTSSFAALRQKIQLNISARKWFKQKVTDKFMSRRTSPAANVNIGRKIY